MICRFKFLPLKEEATAAVIADLVDIIDQSGLDYQLTAEGTLLEGSREDIFQVVGRCLRHAKQHHGLERFHFSLTGDQHHEETGQLFESVLEVERRLGRELQTAPPLPREDEESVADTMMKIGESQAFRDREALWWAAATATLLGGLGGMLWWMGREGGQQ